MEIILKSEGTYNYKDRRTGCPSKDADWDGCQITSQILHFLKDMEIVDNIHDEFDYKNIPMIRFFYYK